ncbi:MAG: DUF6599 family protein [Acidobacteriota bacterium]
MQRVFLFSVWILLGGVQLVLGEQGFPQIWQAVADTTDYRGNPEVIGPEDLPKAVPQDAEFILEYGFAELQRAELSLRGESLGVEIYRMLDPTSAFGAYSFLTGPRSDFIEGLADDAVIGPRGLEFRRGRYYVRLRPRSSSVAQAQLIEVARAICSVIPQSPLNPPILREVPKENLITRSEVLILGYKALNHKQPFGGSDIFGLANGAEAVLAEYRFPQDSARMLLIHYPTQQLAKKFLESGYASYAAQYPQKPLFFKREGPQVTLVWGARSPETAIDLLDKTSYVSSVSWDPSVQPIGVGQLLVRIFVFGAFLLGITLLAGILFGGVRVLLRRLFPNRFFDRPEVIEMIRLNLKDNRK